MIFRNGFLALILSMAVTFPAAAHVTLEKNSTKPGSFFKTVLKVPHGCDGSPTEKLRVEIPEGIIAVKPMPKPGWQIETTKGKYAKSYAFHGKDVTEGVTAISWTGGSLPDEYYDEFVFSAYAAATLSPKSKLYFKVTQSCADGELEWSEIPAKGTGKELERPAPSLQLVR